jgi:hypothetical protein
VLPTWRDSAAGQTEKVAEDAAFIAQKD